MWATVLFAPFQMVQVLDLGFTTILAFQLFGALFILRWLGDLLLTNGRIRVCRADLLAVAFLGVCVLSLTMAVVNAGEVATIAGIPGRWITKFTQRQPLHLSVSNFTQLLYLLFGVLLFYFLVREIRRLADLKLAVKILIYDVLILAAMSLAGGLLFTLGQGGLYRDFLSLFTVGPANIKPPDILSFGQFYRTYTLAGEPGFTAVPYVFGLGVLTGLTLGDRPQRWDISFPRTKLALVAFALLVNGSTTGYLGAFLLAVWVPFAPVRFGRTSWTRLRRGTVVLFSTFGILLVAGAVLEVAGVSFVEFLREYHMAKFAGETGGSGWIRFQVTDYTLREVFLASPLLGVGYGSHLSLSLASFLLSNVGLLGFTTFILFLYSLFRHVSSVASQATGELGHLAFALALTFLPFMGMLFIAKAASGLIFGVTWLLFALSEGAYRISKTQDEMYNGWIGNAAHR